MILGWSLGELVFGVTPMSSLHEQVVRITHKKYGEHYAKHYGPMLAVGDSVAVNYGTGQGVQVVEVSGEIPIETINMTSVSLKVLCLTTNDYAKNKKSFVKQERESWI